MGDVSLIKVSGSPTSRYVVDRDTGDTLGIVHRVERRYTLLAGARTVVEWDPVAWLVESAPVHGAPHGHRGAAVAWIVEQHAERAAANARREMVSEPSVGPGDAIAAVYTSNLITDALIERCAKATGSYASDVDVILAWLNDQRGRTHICPVCQQST